METLAIFKEVATNVNNTYIKNFKNNGGKIIGYNCSFLPVGEIYDSASMLGFRLRANEAESTTIGDAYYGAVICGFPKRMLQMAADGKYGFLDGLVTSTGCDAMRRIYDCWEKAAEDGNAMLPSFFRLFGIPHKSLDFNREWFQAEIRDHIRDLEEHFSVDITEEKLNRSIKKFNKARGLLQELDRLRQTNNPPISGAAALAVMISSTGMPMDDYIILLTTLLGELKENRSTVSKKRLMIVGSVNDDIAFIKSMEEEGCIVVADALCFGSRFFENYISENGNPIQALARGYLDDVKCPRMIGQYKARRSYIIEKATTANVDGVILQNIKFCDLHGSENGVLEKDLEKRGLPCLVLEREYKSSSDTGRLKMRIDAFLRRISTYENG